MWISNFSITHRTMVVVFLILIVAGGIMSYRTLPREAAPDIKIPYIIVSSPYEGASPSDMESLVTRPLERKIKGISEIKEMRSTSAEGFSSVVIEFEPDVDLDSALQKVRDKVNEAKQDLPDDLEEPTVKEASAADIFPVMFIMISGDVGLTRLKNIAEDLEEDIEGIKGVLEAETLGGLEREIRVEFDPDRLSAYGLTMAEIVQTVTRNNINTPAGSLDLGEAKYSIKAPAEFDSPDDVDHLVVSVREGQPVYLSDLAVVRDTFKDRESYSRINGQEAVAIRVTKRSGENLLRIAREVKALIAEYRERIPAGVSLTVTSDSSKHIDRMVADLENNMVSGLILVLAVVFLALGIRNAVIVSLAIPFSMLITFMALEALGISLNMVVLFSLILALGMLVDNAIVIVENIYRHYTEERRGIIEAAMVATQEVAWPVISSTATTVVAFAPLAFWPGIMGEFMGYLPRTVILTLSASLLVALMITPALCAIFLRVSRSRREKLAARGEELGHGLLTRAYRAFLQFGLRFRVLSVSMFFGLLAVMIYTFGASGLGLEMFPDTEPARIMVDITAPEGTRVEQTNNFALRAEKIISNYGNIEFVTTSVGPGSSEDAGPHTARVMIDMVDREFRRAEGTDGKIYFRNSNDTLSALRRELTAAITGAEVKVDKEKEGPPVGAPVNVEITGDDYETLALLAGELQERIKDIPGVVDLRDDYVAGLPEIKILVDRERAALLGLDAFLIGQMVKAAVNGIKIADYREAEDEYDITARLPEEKRQSLSDILRLNIPNSIGEQIPLTSVARIEQTSGLSSIKHIDQKRVVTVSANVAKGFNSQAVLAQVRGAAGEIPMPPGYRFAYTGENEEFEESRAFMTKAFIYACLMIALVLVTQFNSVAQPFIIMTSVVLSLIGVFLGLLLTQKPFGVIMTGMGVISLAGVVVNNAIVLLDYTNQLRERGYSCYDALVRAGCVRLRPVLLTAITTILGLVPMAIGVSYNFRQMRWEIGSESSQWWGAMAAAVIFGLVVATALTLFVAPNLYSLLYDWGLWRRRSEKARASEPAADGKAAESPAEAVEPGKPGPSPSPEPA